MSGFSSINTALSALRYNQMAMDVASGNVANVGTEGYVRRTVNGVSVGAPSQAALWSRYDGTGGGVRVGSLDRMADALLDVRARLEHGTQAYLDLRSSVLDRVESGIGEPGDNGVAAAMADFRQGWHHVANDPSSGAARSQLLARANTLTASINAQARNIDNEASDQRAKLQAIVAEVNTVASDLASTNKSIGVAKLNGTDAGSLLDQRDQLAMRLADLTGATGQIDANGRMNVTLDGVALVDGDKAGTLRISQGVTPTGASDGEPVTFSIVTPSPTGSIETAVDPGTRGEIGAVTDLLNTTLPTYLDDLNTVVNDLVTAVNALHKGGYGTDGGTDRDFFSVGATGGAASTLTVAITDIAAIGASNAPGVNDGSIADSLGQPYGAETAYQQMVNRFGTDVASARRLAANQGAMTAQIDGAREQLGGVNLDEEMMNLIVHQRAYEAAARVISTIDSVLDTLINRTGMLR